jgi:DNA-binding NarL/FixJ family response regulator
LAELSIRERQVLELVANGLSNQENGSRLGLAEKTIKHYMTNILGKLKVRSRVEAALLAAGVASASPAPERLRGDHTQRSGKSTCPRGR